MTRYSNETSIAAALGSEPMRETTAAGSPPAQADNPSLELVKRIPVSVQVVLGSSTMTVAELMKLGRGSVVVLDRTVGEPVEILVNGRVVARGEVVVVEEQNSRLGVSLTEIVSAPSPSPFTQRVK